MSPLSFSLVHTQATTKESIYPNHIPDFVASALDDLYGNVYASLATLKSTNLCRTNTYVKWIVEGHQQHPEAIFLFQKNEHAIRVVTEGMRLKKEDVDCFCNFIFNHDKDINRIDFHAVAPPRESLSRPNLSWACTEDIVVTLPNTEQEYLQQLGKATRKSIKKHLARAQRSLENFSHKIHLGSDVSEDALKEVVRFNHSRMAGKEKLSALDTQATNELIALIRSHGIVGLIASDHGLGAGTLACRFGDDMFSLITAHDPAYDAFGLGTLSRHLMIIYSIESGIKRFHLLGGNISSKRSALGVREKLAHLTVYRSSADILRYPKTTLQLATNALAYHIHCWIEDQSSKPENSVAGRLINSLRRWIRACRRMAKPSLPSAVAR